MTRGSDSLHFLYDAQGKPAEVIFNGTAYRYLYNLQGDVVALVDGSGTKVVDYGYDAWGKTTEKTGSLASTLGTVQPFRYRGYVWDEETELYYLRSRYYRAEWSRFISGDELVKGNLYCYCGNEPVTNTDSDGHDYIVCPPQSPVTVVSLENTSIRRLLERGTEVSTFQIGRRFKEGIRLEDGSDWIIDTGYVKSYRPVTYVDVFGTTEMQRGHRGKYVIALQEALSWAGYYDGEIDGIFGKRTKNAVIEFRRDYLGDTGSKLGGAAGPRVKESLFNLFYSYYDAYQAWSLQNIWNEYNASGRETIDD